MVPALHQLFFSLASPHSSIAGLINSGREIQYGGAIMDVSFVLNKSPSLLAQ